MIEIVQTKTFAKWHDGLKDKRGAAKISQRLVRVQSGLVGDVKFFDGIGELKIDYGPGYRVYFVKQGSLIIVLLNGGDKKSQKRDITKAREMAKELEDGN
uniref:type II toxin-antitoxin system RelE/ParE family toxin n=1 Tax=Pararhizobium sp. IMCC3301 TaxID=3067904 RepID=UPI0027420489|nr:type II toxin-antitoxin system RelE/ParE family toxin [Pararhizobium sp. IMCC3301]